jgi:pimeloyl-ACP methyl ester carboxylesterase
MEKIFIKNRKDQKLALLLDKNREQKGLVFVMHGLGGFKEQTQIQTFGAAFKNQGFTVVYFDTTNSIGESGGRYEEATVTNYYKDLEDVINWVKKQQWYQQPFVLSGHSLGSLCISLYAERYPHRVLALAPISAVVSGKLSVEAHKKFEPEDLKEWEKTGWQERESRSKPGVLKRLPWSHVTDRLKYDLLPQAYKLTMPVLLIVGEKDTSTPPDHVQKLYEALPGPKEFHIIKNAPHSFRDQKHLDKIEQLLTAWIERLNRRQN